MTVVTVIVIYFLYPETKKKSLEELASYFGETVITEVDASQSKLQTNDGGEKSGAAIEHSEHVS